MNNFQDYFKGGLTQQQPLKPAAFAGMQYRPDFNGMMQLQKQPQHATNYSQVNPPVLPNQQLGMRPFGMGGRPGMLAGRRGFRAGVPKTPATTQPQATTAAWWMRPEIWQQMMGGQQQNPFMPASPYTPHVLK
jgi:hypothetical protein